MKNSLALTVRRTRTSLRTDVNTGPSCGSRSRNQSGSGSYGGYSAGIAAPPPPAGGGGAVAVGGQSPAAY
ncbi:MAG: hypothetical protein U0174_01275 [Polyangiaceae bacterium]